ncbi:hypothetical protein ACLB2K_034832 [Fragaria x ananassa]
MLIIRFLRYKLTGSRLYIHGSLTFDSPACLVKDIAIFIKLHDFLLASARKKHTAMLVEILTSMNIPKVEHQTIIGKVFLAAEMAVDDLGLQMLRVMVDATVKLKRPKFVDLECLEKVRLDSLEDTTRRKESTICKESLDHFEDQLMITRLPCLHLYHRDCIVR